jgi:hypothetical protein
VKRVKEGSRWVEEYHYLLRITSCFWGPHVSHICPPAIISVRLWQIVGILVGVVEHLCSWSASKLNHERVDSDRNFHVRWVSGTFMFNLFNQLRTPFAWSTGHINKIYFETSTTGPPEELPHAPRCTFAQPGVEISHQLNLAKDGRVLFASD